MFTGIDAVTVIPRRRWTAVASFSVQAAVVAAALAIPLMYPNVLPDGLAPRRIFVPISSPVIGDSKPTPHPGTDHGSLAAPVNRIFVVPDNGFHFMKPGPSVGADEPPVLPPGMGPSTPIPGPTTIGNALPPPVHATLQPSVRVSRAMQSYLIHRVEPRYPDIARVARVEGAVLIRAVISADGRIEQAQVVNGSPLLSGAALDAIKQWRYRPYFLNDKPVEVETEITVNFYLTR